MTKIRDAIGGILNVLRNIESSVGDGWMNVHTGTPKHFKGSRGLNRDAYDFEPNSHYSVMKAIGMAALKPSDTAIVLGCGKGRILCHLARKQIKKAIGIELDPALFEAARNNTELLRGKKAQIQVENVDAAIADMSEGNVFFMFNPFGETTLRTVLANIEKTRNDGNSPTRIVYINPVHNRVFSDFPWLTKKLDLKRKTGMRVLTYEGTVRAKKSLKDAAPVQRTATKC